MTTKSKQDKHKMSEIDENISKMFDIKKRLGKGAYGIVWKALDKRNNETIAVKKIFDAFRDETDAQRTFREIIFLKAFRSHPNVVKLHNVYRASNNLDIYLIFEYMESDLHNIIKKGSILKDIHKRYVMYQLINAVKYIHSGNVIHRDLKPSNVLIDSKCRCKLADFGLARSVAHRPVQGESNDLDSDISVEPLLTDYVATRWYRAPEILLASKRYTKGIDMWSLGCILGEMIRGKPLFQGSSTVNQIEKIVSALPDITDHDVKAVGAGYGSVLLNKTISKEKKVTLNELLIDASKDALDLVKSLLVLDPMGRLTAKEAISHTYLEKFRNSIPERELNIDILPPFRDDVRLSVAEYRSKLYEILNVTGAEKRLGDVPSKTVSTNTKQRETRGHEKSDSKKPVRNKTNVNTSRVDDRYITAPPYGTGSNTNAAYRFQSKISPLSRRKQNSSSHDVTAKIEGDNLKSDQIILLEDGSKLNHVRDNLDKPNLPHVTRHSIANTTGSVVNHSLSSSKKRLPTSQRLCRSSTTLNAVDDDMNCKTLQQRMNPVESATLMAPILKTALRTTKSELHYPPNTVLGNDKMSSHPQEPICYERRLKKLEEKIERCKNELKTFCRETFIHSKLKHDTTAKESQEDKQNNHGKAIRHNATISANTPISVTYVQLLTKSNHQEAIASDFDASSGNSGGSDRFLHAETKHSFSGRSIGVNKKPNKQGRHPQRSQHHHQCPDQMNFKTQQSRPPSRFT